MQLTGTHFNYFSLCHRKLWLFANGMQMEHTSDLVEMGKLIHETTYPSRTARYEEVEISGIKVDFYDPKLGIIHEIKKSNKMEHAHEVQLKYYMWVFEQNGIKCNYGILEYPKLRKTEEVYLTEMDREEFPGMMADIEEIILSDVCPPREKISICKNCSYFDFCWSGEPNEQDE
ncbi:CRISPR-associated protein Cas4 [Lentimicrobium sp.]